MRLNRRIVGRRTGVLIGLGLVVGSTAAHQRTRLAATAWPMYQHDPGHSGRSPFAAISTTPTLIARIQWRLDYQYSQSTPAVAADGRLYWGFDDDFVVISTTGTILGGGTHLSGGDGFGSSPVIAPDGSAYAVKNAVWSMPMAR